MSSGYTGIFGLIVFALDIWAIISVVGSSADTLKKILWIVAIVVLPLLGFIAWFFAGPRAGRA